MKEVLESERIFPRGYTDGFAAMSKREDSQR